MVSRPMRIILPERRCSSGSRSGSCDSDRSVILPIVILLMADRCDFGLIFSLIYILMYLAKFHGIV